MRAAHRLAPQYPDGQLHIDLRGYTPGDQPVTAGMALDTLLRALGVPGSLIPDDVPARTALWRATLIGKRLLILFDNAADAATVRPLLPASSGSLTRVPRPVDLLPAGSGGPEPDGADGLLDLADRRAPRGAVAAAR
uniref:Uncharacterized protein n=1 Tax=Streptomyces sp. NBC_00008 TaxID=2903610 RepID=A0AAU2W0P1_9ACTN